MSVEDCSKLDRLQALNSAILRAIPDLMFVIRKDGTYLDCHANDPKMLYVPPSAFIGKTIRQVMPRSLTRMFGDAIARALSSVEPVEINYELPIDGKQRFFEARLTACNKDQVVAVVRDLTEIEKARAQSHDLAGRLIASQEMERMRIARELHDDLSQKVALLNIEIDRLVAPGSAMRKLVQSQKRLAVQVGELVHDLNQLAHQLHPSKVHTLGLTPSVRSICGEFSKRFKISASFAHGAMPNWIDPNVSLCLYRITQEALHNVVRHSRARHVSVTLDSERGALSLRDRRRWGGFRRAARRTDRAGSDQHARAGRPFGRHISDPFHGHKPGRELRRRSRCCKVIVADRPRIETCDVRAEPGRFKAWFSMAACWN